MTWKRLLSGWQELVQAVNVQTPKRLPCTSERQFPGQFHRPIRRGLIDSCSSRQWFLKHTSSYKWIVRKLSENRLKMDTFWDEICLTLCESKRGCDDCQVIARQDNVFMEISLFGSGLPENCLRITGCCGIPGKLPERCLMMAAPFEYRLIASHSQHLCWEKMVRILWENCLNMHTFSNSYRDDGENPCEEIA